MKGSVRSDHAVGGQISGATRIVAELCKFYADAHARSRKSSRGHGVDWVVGRRVPQVNHFTEIVQGKSGERADLQSRWKVFAPPPERELAWTHILYKNG